MAAVPITAIISAAAALAVNLTDGTVAFGGSVAASASLAADGTANTIHQVAGSITAAAALATDGVRGVETSGIVPASAALIAGLSAAHSLSAYLTASAALQATALVDGQGLLVRDAVLVALGTLEESCGCDVARTDVCLREAIIATINASLQTIFSRADRLGYFNKETVTLEFANGETSQGFDASVQAIHGPVRLDSPRINLREVTDRAQFDQYTQTFYGTSVPIGPRAFYLHAAHTSGGDSVALTLHVTPTPTEDVNVLVDVIVEPPRYTWADVALGTPLNLPHKYAETLLLPLVREWATSHELFGNKELLPQIKQQADAARQTLGLIDPKKPRGPREAATPTP